jgi:hypothetical protein
MSTTTEVDKQRESVDVWVEAIKQSQCIKYKRDRWGDEGGWSYKVRMAISTYQIQKRWGEATWVVETITQSQRIKYKRDGRATRVVEAIRQFKDKEMGEATWVVEAITQSQCIKYKRGDESVLKMLKKKKREKKKVWLHYISVSWFIHVDNRPPSSSTSTSSGLDSRMLDSSHNRQPPTTPTTPLDHRH